MRSLEILAQLGIAHLGDRPFPEMSVGEQRRALLARALVHDPHTLILDEPTTGLDVQACFQYLQLLRHFIRDGGTVILVDGGTVIPVTHHVHEIPHEVQRVVLLKDGRIQEDGAKQDVLIDMILPFLYDVKIQLIYTNGWYQILPPAQAEFSSRELHESGSRFIPF